MADKKTNRSDVEGFVGVFAHSLGARNRDGFLDHLLTRVHPAATWHQPLARTARSHLQIRQMYRPLYDIAPDLHGTIDRWAATTDGVMVEYVLHAMIGRRTLHVPVVDRFVLEDGYAVSDHSYLDPLPLLPALMARPGRAAKLWRRFK